MVKKSAAGGDFAAHLAAGLAADVAGAGLLGIGALAAGVAHELNNLLAALGFQLEPLRTDAEAHDRRLAAIDRLSERGAEYSAVLLALAHQQAPGGWLPLAGVLERGLTYLRLVWYGKHLNLEMAVPVPAASVLCPVSELAWYWVLRHLAATAPRGWVGDIHVSKARGRIILTVAPHGAGIPELMPGAGVSTDACLRALHWLVASTGGDAAVSVAAAPAVALWLPCRTATQRRSVSSATGPGVLGG